MYNSDPLWKRTYITRKIGLFFVQYSETLLFKISSPLSSVFWILSSLAGSTSSTYLQWTAVSTLILPAVYFFLMFRPFNVTIGWRQIKPNSKMAERANHRGHVYINEHEEHAEVRVTVLFDPSVDSYSLQFKSDYFNLIFFF